MRVHSRRRVRARVGLSLGLVVGLLGSGCGGHVSPAATTPPPPWLAQPPVSPMEVCAVGVNGPTYYQEDAKRASQAAALALLARSVEVRVKAELHVRETGDSRGSDTVVQQEAGFSSDVVMKHAQVREQWTQPPGGEAQYGTAGTTYTLACLPLAAKP